LPPRPRTLGKTVSMLSLLRARVLVSSG